MLFATLFEQKFSVFSHFIYIRVKDNGVGFDLGTVKSSSRGFGLTGAQERVKILNGNLIIESRINAGANFVIEIPI